MRQPQPQPPIPADQVRDLYGLHAEPGSWQFLGNAGGFSGAAFWRFSESRYGKLTLRFWPASFSLKRIRWIHGALRHVRERGLTFVPVPLVHRLGDTVFQVDGRFAELAPWLSGAADFCQRPTVTRLEHAMHALAQLHIALASFESHPPGIAPGLLQRRDRWRSLVNQGITRLLQISAPQANRDLMRFVPCLASSVARAPSELSGRLDAVAKQVLPLQVCLRDIWHDHLLFVDDEVSGIVDFDALRVDSICLDLVRLLQSLIGNDDIGWRAGLAAYQELRPVAEAEQALIPVLRQVNPILSVATWLEWGLLEGRQFEDLNSVIRRLESWLSLLA